MSRPVTFEEAHQMAAEIVRTYEDLGVPVFVVVMEPGGNDKARAGEDVRTVCLASGQMADPCMSSPLSNAIVQYSYEWQKAVKAASEAKG